MAKWLAADRHIVRKGAVAMRADQKRWLEQNAVTCRVFKGRWSIRHCLKMHNDIKDLKIHMSSRVKGRVTRHESAYNPCERCKVLTTYIDNLPKDQEHPNQQCGNSCNEAWAV